jgi:ABC-type arginine transport system ATPase subunit
MKNISTKIYQAKWKHKRKNCALINREINSLTKIEKEIIKNRFNLTHSLNGSIIKIMSRKTGLLFKKYEFTSHVAILGNFKRDLGYYIYI